MALLLFASLALAGCGKTKKEIDYNNGSHLTGMVDVQYSEDTTISTNNEIKILNVEPVKHELLMKKTHYNIKNKYRNIPPTS